MAAALGAAWAFLVLLSGGFAFGRLVSRDPIRPLILSATLAVIGRVVSPLDFDAAFARLAGPRERWPARIAAVTAAAVLVVATAWNTRAAGGSDSSCYVLQADAFAHGRAVLRHPLAGTLSDAVPAMFAPTGFIASPRDPFAAVPICAPGLALAMAVVRPLGKNAVFMIVPVCAACAIWLAFVFARRAADEVTGAAAACLLACSPVFLYQAVQPMSDVPATLFCLAALAATARGDRAGQIGGGVCASLAVLVRPNLALAVVPLLWLLPDRRAWARWIVSAVPALTALAVLNAIRYGSPFTTGYGSTGALFSMGHVAPNLARYPRWFVDTESPLAILAVAAPWVMRGDRARRRLAIVALVSSGLVAAPYLAYTVFDDWWYLRFLLPLLPVVLVYAVALVLRLVPDRFRAAAALLLASGLGAWCVHVAAARHVFELQGLESRFVRAGRSTAATPEETVFIAGQQTASIRYYGDRPTLAWDAIPPDRLDRVVAELERHGAHVMVALEDAEAVPFRERFAGERVGQLDWRPSEEVRAAVRVRIWDVSEHAMHTR
ncbi:MAG TPA: glycosyltransferase family 39 protein [Vicinamibacterales bacterium]|nr:glycosyltransferase family 39 protein [Vicinamibacterales bacterium]